MLLFCFVFDCCFVFFQMMMGFVGSSKYHYKGAIIGPPAKRYLNGVSLEYRWCPNIECWLGSFVIFQGIRTSITKKPYIIVIFQGGPNPLPPPSSSTHAVCDSFHTVDNDMIQIMIQIKIVWDATCDFQQCDISTCVDSGEPLQPPCKLRNSKLCSVGSLRNIQYSSD